jgi:TolB-like protein/tetratricopeptide (TPR) repeat protein
MSAEVFVSYARVNRERVLQLVERMRSAGVGVWIDEGGIHGASLWGQEIVDAIESSKVMVLMLSDASITSDNVVKELSIASEDKKPILPVYLHQAVIPKSMRYQLAGIQHIEYFEGNEDAAFRSMCVALSRLGVSNVSEGGNAEGEAVPVRPHRTEPPTKPSAGVGKGKWVTALLGLAVVGLVLTLVLRPGKTPDPNLGQAQDRQPSAAGSAVAQQKNKTSLAVIPFRNIGPASEENYLAEGMHEEIDAMLSMTPSLVVRNASRMKETTLDPKAIGEMLKVDAILIGTVRQAGGQLRVTVKLVDTKTEANIWAKTFDKTESDVFSVQREIAQSVAEGLKLELGQAQQDQLAKRQTKSLEAYNLYLQGRKMWQTRTREGMRGSIEKYELALAKDPNFALAHVGVADAYIFLAGYGFTPPKIALPKMERELQKALEINPKLPEAYASYGVVKYNYHWDWVGSEEAFKKAISINPNYPEARRWYSHLLLILNRFQESHQQMDMGIKLKPTSPIMHYGKSSILVRQSKFVEVKEIGIRVVSSDPDFVAGLNIQAQGEFGLGNFDESLKLANEGLAKFNNQKRFLRSKLIALHALGRSDEVKQMRDELFSKAESELVSPMILALAEYCSGNEEAAIQKLEQSVEDKDVWLFPFDPRKEFEKLIGNPRFDAIWEKVGLPELKN